MKALWVWKQFPRQIASDLSRYHHRRIAEWHSGVMSSYEMLELLEFMEPKGAFKTAVRDYEYSEEDQVWRYIATELAKLRATMHAVHGGERYVPKVYMTLAEMRENMVEAEQAEERREEIFQFADRSSRPPPPKAIMIGAASKAGG